MPDAPPPSIVFVYNAGTGLFNLMADTAHKMLSPGTYACSLCAVTHTPVGMRRAWKQFLESLDVPVQFLHRDQWRQEAPGDETPLPAAFLRRGTRFELWITAAEIGAGAALEDLMALVRDKITALEKERNA